MILSFQNFHEIIFSLYSKKNTTKNNRHKACQKTIKFATVVKTNKKVMKTYFPLLQNYKAYTVTIYVIMWNKKETVWCNDILK